MKGTTIMIVAVVGFLMGRRTLCQNTGSRPPIRLAGGNESQGRVEMFHNFHWGTICSDGWDDFDANVICRMLGFNGISKAVQGEPTSATPFGPGSGPIHMRSVTCDGNEQSILDCRSQQADVTQCNHMEDAGVMCFNLPSTSPTTTTKPPWFQTVPYTHPPRICTTPNENVELRWENNVTSQFGEGRVLYKNENSWKGVCNDQWGQNEANVVCRMLCYNPVYSVPIVVRGEYGNFSDEGFWLTGVKCNGAENDLSECQHPGWGDNNTCNPGDVAAVNCLGNMLGSPKVSLPWVDCDDPDSIIAIFSLRQEPRLLPSHMRVIDSSGSTMPQCAYNATSDGEFVYVVIPLQGCNAIRTVNDSVIIYSNYLSYTIPYSGSVITRTDSHVFLVSCVMTRNGVEVGSFGLLPIDASEQIGKGQYVVKLLRYTDSTYSVVRHDKGFSVGLNEWVYAAVQLFSNDVSLKLILVYVYVSASEQGFLNDTIYFLIEDKCAVDETTTLILYNSTVIRFRFRSMRFISRNDSDILYMHAKTQICVAAEISDSCFRGCSKATKARTRRSALSGSAVLKDDSFLWLSDKVTSETKVNNSGNYGIPSPTSVKRTFPPDFQ